ncbi:MAG: hypothetical protein ACRDKY_03930 [Solirubrobacteraceae bacterium]
MKLDKRSLAVVAAIAAGAFAAGCGDVSMAGAKKNLVDRCDDQNPKAACTCIADELEKAGESAKSIDGLANGDGRDPKVIKAGRACVAKG